jgi:hypothetical protein
MGTQFIPAFFLICGLPFPPRSFRWLVKVGREKEAIETLANIQASGNIKDPLVIAEWEEITAMMRAEQEAGPGWRKFFKVGSPSHLLVRHLILKNLRVSSKALLPLLLGTHDIN